MNTQETVDTKNFSLNVEIEKLDGGYISNITGKRKIFKDAFDVDEAIDMKNILSKIEDNEYVLNILLSPKNGDISMELDENKQMSYDDAKKAGIIKEVDTFNPFPNAPKEEDLTAPIVVTDKNAYSSAKLSSIDWKGYHEKLPMSVGEKALICNFNKISMYGLSKKLIDGNAKFHLSSTRVAATILAKFYERNLGVRNSYKEQLDMVSTGLLEQLRELEILTGKNPFTKSKDVAVFIGKMRKLLIQ